MNPCSRDYPVQRIFGGCTEVGAIDNGPQCTELINDGGIWETSRRNLNRPGFPPCFSLFPLFQYRICTKERWPNKNLIPCCTEELDSANACASDWCPGSATCAKALQPFCTENNGENILSNQCKTLCQNPPDGRTKTWCDIASSEFCQQPENRNDPYCGCINSPNPPALACFDAQCKSAGYRTRQLEEDINRCIESPSNLCLQVINCNNSGNCNFDNIELTSKCQQQIDITVPVKTEPVDTGITEQQNDMPLTPVTPVAIPTTPVTPVQQTFSFTIIIIIIIIVVIVIIIFIIIYYSYTGK